MTNAFTEADELRVKAAALYDALTHARAIARKALLPDGDMDEALRRVVDVVTRAKDQLDNLNDAAMRKGYELADEEILALAESAGGWHYLTTDGQIRWLGAMKRLAARPALVTP